MLADAVAVQPPPAETGPVAAQEAAAPEADAPEVDAPPRGAARSFERSPLFHALGGDAAPLVVPNHPPRASTLFAVAPTVGA